MPQKSNAIYHWICGLFLGSANAVGWLNGPEAGTRATMWSAVGLMIIGLVVRAIGEVGRAINKFWEEREELKIKLQAARDKADETSLSAQLQHVRASLHDLRNQANITTLRHTEEANRLTEQLEITTGELHAARDQIRGLEEKLARPIQRLAVKQEAQDRKIEANAQKIDDVVSKSGVFPAASEPHPTDQG
jgi:uncharacterized protein YoxC